MYEYAHILAEISAHPATLLCKFQLEAGGPCHGAGLKIRESARLSPISLKRPQTMGILGEKVEFMKDYFTLYRF